MSDRALKAAEAATILGVTERYVWRLGREGALPRIKHVGRKYVRFLESDVYAYRESGHRVAARDRSVQLPGRSFTPQVSRSGHSSHLRRRF